MELKGKSGISLLAECRRSPVKLILPWPPSVNEAYMPFRSRIIKTKIARTYFNDVSEDIFYKRIPSFGKARIKVLIKCYAPNPCAYDLANLDKILMDTIEKSGLFKNDNQIDDIRYKRMFVKPPGYVQVIIQEI